MPAAAERGQVRQQPPVNLVLDGEPFRGREGRSGYDHWKVRPEVRDASATAPAWADIERLLIDAQLYWIITVRAGGRSHAVPLVGVWLEGAWFSKCGEDWTFDVRGQEFVERSHSGGSTSGGAWVYRVLVAKVIAFGDGHGQTTYRL